MDQGMLQRFTLADIEAAMFEDGGFCILYGEPSETPSSQMPADIAAVYAENPVFMAWRKS